MIRRLLGILHYILTLLKHHRHVLGQVMPNRCSASILLVLPTGQALHPKAFRHGFYHTKRSFLLYLGQFLQSFENLIDTGIRITITLEISALFA